MFVAVVVLALIGLWIWGGAQARKTQREREAANRARLVGLYGEVAAARILAKEVWQGATLPMLLESQGQPADIKEKVLKNSLKHTYCYGPTGKNRFLLRVHLEAGVVVGWEK